MENLWEAARRASLGRRRKPYVARFLLNLEDELTRLQEELRSRTYRPGPYSTFRVYEPKERLISAAPFRDRVVHHALVRVIQPLFERRFVFDSWANRLGKGTHRALERFQGFSRRFRYVLKGDIRKYFPSIDHEILKAKIRRVIRCPGTLWLLDAIIDASNPQDPVVEYFPGDDILTPLERRKGLPIGNLTSQFFANVYLDDLDHFVKDDLGVKAYLRYVDDFAAFSDDKRELGLLRERIVARLHASRLSVHERKTRVYRTDEGVRFLGFRVWPRLRRLDRSNVLRFRRRLRRFQKAYAHRRMSAEEIGRRIRCWVAHARHGDTARLVATTLEKFVFVPATTTAAFGWRRVFGEAGDRGGVRRVRLPERFPFHGQVRSRVPPRRHRIASGRRRQVARPGQTWPPVPLKLPRVRWRMEPCSRVAEGCRARGGDPLSFSERVPPPARSDAREE